MSPLFTVGQIVAVYLTRKPEVFRCAKVVFVDERSVSVQGELCRFGAEDGLELCRGFRKRRISSPTPDQLAVEECYADIVERWEAFRAVRTWLAKVHSGEAPIGDVRAVLAMIGGEK